jgi:hypothetical protein
MEVDLSQSFVVEHNCVCILITYPAINDLPPFFKLFVKLRIAKNSSKDEFVHEI